ncbi:proton channel OtopLc-like [Lutzomyia longipalpis]|uniref:proton channel OtopLc-like n=1 Tax=Lutzomyia longipalpis TaxID=7200 RepID=UPI0024846A21|nr:proton channel OtopLc-like [Lutzomyia longipalpis]
MDTVVEETHSETHPMKAEQVRPGGDLSVLLTPPTPTAPQPSPSPLLPDTQCLVSYSQPSSRRMTGENTALQEMVAFARRPSAVIAALRRNSTAMVAHRRLFLDLLPSQNSPTASGSKQSLNNGVTIPDNTMAYEARMKNRRIGEDAISTALSALYAKLIVVLGIALPVTDILSVRGHASFYQGFYLYLYLVSVAFVTYMYVAHVRSRTLFTILNSYHEKTGESLNRLGLKQEKIARYGSFYLRVGAVAFGIGSMVYSGLEFGQYFELKGESKCQNVLVALSPATRMILSIVQMQFIFLNTKEFEMGRHKVIARFGLMHMVATNLCEWLYVLIEETKHEIVHIVHQHLNDVPVENVFPRNVTSPHHLMKRGTSWEIVVECRRTNIMGSLVQNASPFLFPCTIEYSLICAVILFEMWKKIKSQSDINRSRRNSRKPQTPENAHHFSVDCARAHRGMFGGILIIVLTIICLIMYFVLTEQQHPYKSMAILEVTISEIILYLVTGSAVVLAFLRMRDLKYSKKHENSGIGLDCTLLLLAQSGVYIYGIFSIIGNFFSISDGSGEGGMEGLIAEVICLGETSLQTIFILNAWWRRCKGAQQNRTKPGREIVTFLLVANMAIWFLNTLVKNRASFRPTHLSFFGVWAWTIITHVSMPLAIFYRFHSTICLFEIWKTAYKVKNEHN